MGNIPLVIYQVRAKFFTAILTICDDVSILRFCYMLRSNPEHSGGRDRSNQGGGTILVSECRIWIYYFLNIALKC